MLRNCIVFASINQEQGTELSCFHTPKRWKLLSCVCEISAVDIKEALKWEGGKFCYKIIFFYCKVKTKGNKIEETYTFFPVIAAEVAGDLWGNLQAHVSKQTLHSSKKKIIAAAVDTWKKCQRTLSLIFVLHNKIIPSKLRSSLHPLVAGIEIAITLLKFRNHL